MPTQVTSSTRTMSDGDVADVLNDLIETSKDGEKGFVSCAEHCKSSDLKATFQKRAEECRIGAQELQTLVARYGEKPEKSGSVAGALHRGWVATKGAVSMNDDLSILEECERGEDVAKSAYRKALEKELPASVMTVVRRQADGVQRNHDQIKRLRDEMRASAR